MAYTYRFGGKTGQTQTLLESTNKLAVRTKNARPLEEAVFATESKALLENFEIEQRYPEADVYILKPKEGTPLPDAMRDRARTALKSEEELRFAGRVLMDPATQTPVLYTENIFVKFKDEVPGDTAEQILQEHGLKLKSKFNFAKNSYFVDGGENIGPKVFDLANALLELPEVEFCHPEIIRKRKRKNVIHNNQWHLKSTTIRNVLINAHISIEEAHKITKGKGITIAIIDDGVDVDHPEFKIPGKVVHSRDASLNSNDPRPKYKDENHGTACAGVATACGIKASGVAPEAKLMPIRLSSALGAKEEAEAFEWAANHGADVISCSWGPEDGIWWDPNDLAHSTQIALPDSTRLAIDHAVKYGRNGKGCVVLFAAGNGNESVENDGYASYDNVIAVSASNDTNGRSVYSDFGASVWCCFPSSDFSHGSHPAPLTTGIYTADLTGAAGYSATDYTDNFGGTSSACPGVAGVVALMLSAQRDLSWQQVKEIIKQSCVKIDEAKGKYDQNGHSIYYGYGKVDARRAVVEASAFVATNKLVDEIDTVLSS